MKGNATKLKDSIQQVLSAYWSPVDRPQEGYLASEWLNRKMRDLEDAYNKVFWGA